MGSCSSGVEDSAHAGQLAWVDKVVSPEPVLTPEVAALCRAVADRYAGVLADVLRLAIPPRHARVEAEALSGGVVAPEAEAAGEGGADRGDGVPVTAGGGDGARDEDDGVRAGDASGTGWARYPRGPALLEALAGGRAAHAVWQALPGESWAQRLAEAAAATVTAGRGALLVAADQRDVAALHAACVARLGEQGVVALTAELGPAERYRRWLAGAPGRGAGRRRHPVGRLRPATAARPARRVGRRRRPARGASGALPARPGRARAPRARRGRGAARRWLRPHR